MADTQHRSETTTITVPRALAAKLRAIADRRDLTMPEALEKYAGGAVEREYRKVVREMSDELGGEGG